MSSSARAHAPPEGIQLVWRAGDVAVESAPLVVTNRGLAFPDGGELGAPFSVRCTEAYGATPASVVYALYDRSGSLVVANTETITSADGGGGTTTTVAVAVRATRDRGCSWQTSSGLPQLPLGSLTHDPSDPEKLLLSTLDYQKPSFVMASADGGRSWSVRASNAPATVYKTLLAGAGGRVYAAGDRYDLVQKKLLPLWASSSDEGATWSEVQVETARVPVGLHPQNVELILAREDVRTSGSYPRNRLLRSEDGGKSFAPLLELPAVTAFASTPDGSQFFLGTVDGLFRSRDQGKTFEQVQQGTVHSVSCLHYRHERLWACANMGLNIEGVWLSPDGGDSWRELLTFAPKRTQARERVVCEGPAANVCEEAWADYARELLGGAADAGTPSSGAIDGGAASRDGAVDDAGSGDPAAFNDAAAPAPREAVRRASEGCSLTEAAESGGSFTSALVGVLALLLWRSRRRRSPAHGHDGRPARS
jgi:hypothetical protein